jgi:hypothetical protein
MTGFDSKRQETMDYLRKEGELLNEWEQEIARKEQLPIYEEFAFALLGLFGLAAVSAITGFVLGLLYATSGRMF